MNGRSTSYPSCVSTPAITVSTWVVQGRHRPVGLFVSGLKIKLAEIRPFREIEFVLDLLLAWGSAGGIWDDKECPLTPVARRRFQVAPS